MKESEDNIKEQEKIVHQSGREKEKHNKQL